MARKQGEGDPGETAGAHRDLTPEILEELRSISDSLHMIARVAEQYLAPKKSPLGGEMKPRFEIQDALYERVLEPYAPHPSLARYKRKKP